MVRNYYGFGYHPTYKYIIKEKQNTIAKSKGFITSVCFRTIFNIFYGRYNNNFESIYKLKCYKHFTEQSGNFCALDKSQVLAILRYMRRVFDIKTNLHETQDYYLFTFHITGKPIKHKFVLTFSRVFYEFPYNEIAVDVFRLRNKGIVENVTYSNKSFIELYNLILNTWLSYCGSGHSLIWYPTLEDNIQSIRKAFKSNKLQVQDVCPGNENILRKFHLVPNDLRNVDLEDTFESRVSIYSENFKILKHEKNLYRRSRKAI